MNVATFLNGLIGLLVLIVVPYVVGRIANTIMGGDDDDNRRYRNNYLFVVSCCFCSSGICNWSDNGDIKNSADLTSLRIK